MLVLLPIILFILIKLPYLNLIPWSDGNVEFKWAQMLYQGHLNGAVLSHPPFKMIILDLFFYLFGPWSVTWVGMILGVVGIYTMYRVGEGLFDKKVGLLSAFLLALSGLYHAVGLFPINDYAMTVLFLLAFSFYVRSRYWLYALFAVLAVFTKEPAVFLTFGLLIVEFFQPKKRLLPLLLPGLALCAWIAIVKLTGHELWNAYNYSSTAKYGSTFTIFYNLISLQFFNKYAIENWLHLFVFNFNWIFTLFAVGSVFLFDKKQPRKALYAIAISSILYCVTLLSFQTWTINRYTLPLLPFLYLLASYTALKIRFKRVGVICLVLIALLSLTSSLDPISSRLWPKRHVENQTLFLNGHLDGNDGITYNLQFNELMRQRTAKILHNQCDFPQILWYDKETLKQMNIKTCL